MWCWDSHLLRLEELLDSLEWRMDSWRLLGCKMDSLLVVDIGLPVVVAGLDSRLRTDRTFVGISPEPGSPAPDLEGGQTLCFVLNLCCSHQLQSPLQSFQSFLQHRCLFHSKSYKFKNVFKI